MTSRTLRVTVRQQVLAFIAGKSPESRHRLRRAIRGLAHERGDIKALEGHLTGLHRLRVGSDRVIFAYVMGGKAVDCIFVESRDVVYLLLERMLRDQAGK